MLLVWRRHKVSLLSLIALSGDQALRQEDAMTVGQYGVACVVAAAASQV
jgi:hypothetical protein